MGHSFAELGRVPYKRLIRFNKSGPTQPLGDGITVTMVHAEHSSELVYTDPQTKKKSVHPGGEPAGYIVELEDGSKIYHAGDRGVFGDMAFIGSYYKPDIALLPIGGHCTMDPAHAAYAASKLLRGTPEQFESALGDAAIEALDKACDAQKQGKTTILEVMCTRELGDPSAATPSRSRSACSTSTRTTRSPDLDRSSAALGRIGSR